jgi:hypothetical protein
MGGLRRTCLILIHYPTNRLILKHHTNVSGVQKTPLPNSGRLRCGGTTITSVQPAEELTLLKFRFLFILGLVREKSFQFAAF